MIVFIRGSKKMIQMNLSTKQKESYRNRKETYGYQRGMGRTRRDKLESGINRYTLLYIKEVTNKDLLYSTGNYTILSILLFFFCFLRPHL